MKTEADREGNLVLPVRFMARQSAEDLYWQPERKRIYARLPCADRDKVKWCTTSKWSGGYEADSPIKTGCVMQVVDAGGAVLFEERLEYSEWLCSTFAPKVGKFSYEDVAGLEKTWAEKLHLRSHEMWREHLLSDRATHGYAGDSDGWLYCTTQTRKTEVLGRVNSLGRELHILRQENVHAVSGRKWIAVLIADQAHEEVCGICGYDWED